MLSHLKVGKPDPREHFGKATLRAGSSIYVNGGEPSIAVFRFSAGRAGKHPGQHLAGFKGTLQQFFEHARTDPKFYFKTREDYLSAVKAVQDKIGAVEDKWAAAAEAKGLKDAKKVLAEYRAEIKKLEK